MLQVEIGETYGPGSAPPARPRRGGRRSRTHCAPRRSGRATPHGLTSFATLLADRGAPKPDLTIGKARELIWTLCAPANYDALVTTRQRSHTEYRDLLSETLAATLLPAEL